MSFFPYRFGHVAPDFLQHIQQHGEIVAKSRYGNGVRNDVKRTDEIAQGTYYYGLVFQRHVIALQSIIKYQRDINEFCPCAFGDARYLVNKFLRRITVLVFHEVGQRIVFHIVFAKRVYNATILLFR